MTIAVVMRAKRSSPIWSFLAGGWAEEPASKGTVRAGEVLGEYLERLKLFGLHFKTASTEALHGWT